MQKLSMYIGLGVLLVVSGVFAMQSYTHCQIPCGIYNDETQFTLMMGYLDTIEKSMQQIEVSMEDDNPNQVVRWVNNKESHADDFTHIVTYYFLAQRIKPTEGDGKDKYLSQLEMLHHMIVFSMKCKQEADTAHVEKLRELVTKFKDSYFG